MTTSKTVNQVTELINKSGGTVGGAMVVVSRDPNINAETLEIPWFHALLKTAEFHVYDPEDCPLCKNRVPMRLRPGHGYEWVKDHPNYPVYKEDL